MANIQRIMDALATYTGDPETLTAFATVAEEELGSNWTNTIYDLISPMTPDQKERLDHAYHYYGATLAWAEVQEYLAQQEPLDLTDLAERVPTLEYWLNFFGDNGLQIINELNEKMKQQSLMSEVMQDVPVSTATTPLETSQIPTPDDDVILPDAKAIVDWSEQTNIDDIQMIDINEDGRTPQFDDTLPEQSVSSYEEIEEPVVPTIPDEEIEEPVIPMIPDEEIEEPVIPTIPDEEIEEPVIPMIPDEEIEEPVIPMIPDEEIEEPVIPTIPDEEIEEPIIPTEDVPYDENTYPTEDVPYDENVYPTEDVPYDENVYPTEDVPYDENVYPTEDTPYDENTYPTEDAPYDENVYPTEDTPYDGNTYPTEDEPYDESAYPMEDLPYDENGYPTENTAQDWNGYPTETTSYDGGTYPTENVSYDTNTYPMDNIPYEQPINNTNWEGEQLTAPMGFVNKIQTLNSQRPQDERIVTPPQYQPQKPETNEQFLAKKAFKQLDFVNGVHAWIEARCIGLGNIEIYKYKHYGFLVDAMEQARKNIKEVLASPAYYPAIEATRLNGLQTLQNSLVALEKDLETAYDNLPGEITNLIKDDINSDEARRMLGMIDTSSRKEYLGPAPDGFEMIDDPFDDANKV